MPKVTKCHVNLLRRHLQSRQCHFVYSCFISNGCGVPVHVNVKYMICQ